MHILKESFLGVCLVLIAMAKAEDVSQALSAVSQGTNQFSSALYQTVAAENSGNLIMSPLSAAIVLAMAAYGARGETENQFREVLHLPSPDSLGTSGYQALIDNLNNITENKLRLANKIFAAQKCAVKPEYQQLTESYFRSIIQMVNFANNNEASGIINAWVEQNTNSRIKDLVSPDDLNKDTGMVLVNAVYFKAQWKLQFEPKNTHATPFHIDEKTVKIIPTMFVGGRFKTGQLPNLQARFVELPYEGDELSMVIILPNEINGLTEVERKLRNANIKDILNKGYTQNVYLYLPKFKVESKINLNDPLGKLGLTNMFSIKANFSVLAAQPLYISKVVQKAFIEVNEEGSEAVGASEMAMQILVESDPPPPATIRVNRPWLFFICKTVSNPHGEGQDVITLFRGRITKIES